MTAIVALSRPHNHPFSLASSPRASAPAPPGAERRSPHDRAPQQTARAELEAELRELGRRLADHPVLRARSRRDASPAGAELDLSILSPRVRRLTGVLPPTVSVQDYRDYLEKKHTP